MGPILLLGDLHSFHCALRGVQTAGSQRAEAYIGNAPQSCRFRFLIIFAHIPVSCGSAMILAVDILAPCKSIFSIIEIE